MKVSVEREIGGRILKLETGELAKQAHGAVVVQFGETWVFVASVTWESVVLSPQMYVYLKPAWVSAVLTSC